MDAVSSFHAHFAQCPLVAIIRGVRPDEVEAIGGAIFEAGIRIIEIPLNSPEPLASIERLAKALGDRATIGAGTVLAVDDVHAVRRAGGRIIVSPGFSREVVEASVSAGLVAAPGYFTPTEAFAAIEAGAHALKLFPAEAASPAVVKAQRAVLPRAMPLVVVGGVTPETVEAYLEAGANGFGLGGSLYSPGRSPDDVGKRARAFVAAVRSGAER